MFPHPHDACTPFFLLKTTFLFWKTPACHCRAVHPALSRFCTPRAAPTRMGRRMKVADAMQASRKNAGCSQPFNHFPRSRGVGKKRKEGCHAFLIESGTSSSQVGGVLCDIGRAFSSVCFFDYIHRFVERGCRGGVRVSALGRRSEGKCGEDADGVTCSGR